MKDNKQIKNMEIPWIPNLDPEKYLPSVWRAKSMFNIEEVEDDEDSGYNAIILGLNRIMNNKEYETLLNLRQNMRGNLSKEKITKPFILSFKTLSESI